MRSFVQAANLRQSHIIIYLYTAVCLFYYCDQYLIDIRLSKGVSFNGNPSIALLGYCCR